MSDRIAFAATVTTDGRRIRGSVQIAGQRIRRAGEWLEIDPAAVVKADASSIVGRWEHDPHKILGRPENGTLKFSRTDQGIEYELSDIPSTSYGNDALELVRGGYVTGSSFEIEGIRSTFSSDPETGERIRRITHISRITDVSPVGNPAFASSTAAAFSKESDVTDIIEEPVAAPKPDDKSDTYRTAEAFAQKQDLASLEAAMDNLLAGEMTPAKAEAYDAFSAVYDDRRRTDANAKDRFERMKLAQDMRLGRVPKAPATGLFQSDDYAHAFSRYIKGDTAALEQFAQAIGGNGTQGGFTVPESFLTRVTETIAAYGGIQQHAEIITTGDGRTLPWPTNDDTANSAVVAAEAVAPGAAGADLVFGEVNLGAFSIAATGAGNVPVKVSWELLQDSQIDFEAFLSRKLGERLGRKMASYYAVGVGTTEPFGLFAKTPDVMTATTFLAAAIEHTFQVNEAYRSAGNCRFIMSDTVLSKVYNSVDKQGRPLFIPSAEASGAGRPAGMLIGYPVQLDQAAAGLVAFGDIGRGFVIRKVRDIQVVVDPYANTQTRQTAYHAWARTDSNIQDSAAVSVSDYVGVTANAV